MTWMTRLPARWFTELRTAFRSSRRTPRLTTFVVVLLALGIGGSTALFGLIEKVLLTPIPTPYADRLIRFSATDPKGNHQLFPLIWVEALERRAEAFDAMSGHTGPMVLVADLPRGTVGVGVETVTGDFFGMLGVTPHAGRLLTRADSDTSRGRAPFLAVLGYNFWQREFGADPHVVGRQFRLDGALVTVVGITPVWFRGVSVELASGIFVTQRAYSDATGVSNPRMGPRTNYVIARRRSEVSQDAAEANLRAVWPTVRDQMVPALATAAEREGLLALRVASGAFRTGASSLRTNYSDPLRALGWLTGVLLALTTASLAGLLVARALTRRRELQVRLALGASHRDLFRQFTAEAVVLAGLGVAVALPLAVWSSQWLVRALWSGTSAPDLSLTPGPITWTALLASTGLVVAMLGGIPALVATRGLARTLSPTSRATSASRRWTQSLLVAQLALSVALVFAAALFGSNLRQWRGIGPGFSADGVTVVFLGQQPGGYRGLIPGPYYRTLVDQLEALPGVDRVGFSYSWSRYSRALQPKQDVMIAGDPAPVAQALSDRSTPGFFDSLHVPLLRGREFSWSDDADHPAVAIVTARLARAIEPGGDVVGKRIVVRPSTSEVEIVGVVADFRPTDIRVTDAALVYRPIAQLDSAASLPAITLRAAGPVNLEEVRRTVASAGREYAIGSMPLAERVDRQLVRERVTAWLGTALATLALLIAATGLGSLLAFLVATRTREFGVRLALGASPRSLWLSVARSSLILAGIGVALGIPLAAGAGRAISAVLIGVSATDTASMVLAGLAVILTAFVAGLLPARRAARVDPVVALRSE